MKKLYWFTGQAGAGKTVLANELKKHFDKLGDKKCVIIDGDDIREIYKNTDYSIEGRKANVDFVQKLCSFLIKNDIVPIVCMVSPFAEQRATFVDYHDGQEIYVTTTEIRGRENFHVDYFELPDILRKNVKYIDTSYSPTLNTFEKLLNLLSI
jgi:adenylylsulfate kinase-like enzyme